MGSFFQDLRYSLRGFRQSPIFTAVALLSIALGVGANTAIFSLMDQALLRSLPVKQPDRLVLFSCSGPRSGWIDTSYGSDYTFSYPLYRDFRDGTSVFDGVFARFPVRMSMSWRGQTDRIAGDLVSGNYFDVLGVHAAIGRTLTNDDDRTPDAHPLVVLSYGYWKRRFGADPGILNQVIQINNHPMTVVGVAQEGFRGVGVGEAPDVFVPMMMRAEMSPGRKDLGERRAMWLNIFARLKPGVPSQQAEAAVNTFWRPILEMEAQQMTGLRATSRARFVNSHLSLLPGDKGISGVPREFGVGLKLLMGMVGLLLLIACANVANLLIARATARQKEIGIRLALGAGRARIVRQLLVESIALSITGGALGIVVAEWTGDALLRFLPADPSTQGLSSQPDTRVLLFAFGLSLLTGVFFGLAPALQSARGGVAGTLKEQAANVMGGLMHLRFRRVMVISQMALSLVLLVGAGLFARSLFNVKNIDPGFRTDHLISFAIQPSLNGYDQARTRALFTQLHGNIAALPGVQATTMTTEALLAGDMDMTGIGVEGYEPKEDERMAANVNHVGPGFFATIGIPLLAGRDFTKADDANAPKVAVVNEPFARYFFGNQNPIGRHIWHTRETAKRPIEIVGVVKESKHDDMREDPLKFVYFPYPQDEVGRITFYTRTSQDPTAAAATLRRQVQRLDANLPIFNVMTMDQQIDQSIFTDRLVATLAAAFGVLATLLAAIGLYGVMAYMVVRRTREIGIRMALGAMPREVVTLVLREVALLAGVGIAIALAASLAMGRVIGSQLFGVSGRDPLVIASATVLLATVAALAGFVPAARAARVDPLIALRYE
jgi:predicted permease